jgi:PiT family inorganic phosphate transporter
LFGLGLSILPGLALCIILGANNLSTCLGTSVGSHALTYPKALTLASIGVFAGILLEGQKLSHAITSGVVLSSDPRLLFAVATSTLVVMICLTYLELPISLSQVVVGAVIGSAIALGIRVSWDFAILVGSSWILTPLVGFSIALALSFVTRCVALRAKRLLTLQLVYGYLTVISGVYASYALGANTVGLIIGMVSSETQRFSVSFLFGVATILGMLLFSKGTTRSVAENIIGLSPSASFASQIAGAITVHGFTQFGIPVSISQSVLGGIFGAAIPRKLVVRNDRLIREIVLGWTAAPILGGALGFVVALAL